MQSLTGEDLRAKALFSCLCNCFLWEECCQFVFFTFIQKLELNCKFFLMSVIMIFSGLPWPPLFFQWLS